MPGQGYTYEGGKDMLIISISSAIIAIAKI